MQESWADYVQLVSKPADPGVTIKIKVPGEAEFLICNIHGRHHRREKTSGCGIRGS